VNQSSAAVLILAAGLFGVAFFALIHRRDAFGAIAAVALGFAAVATALVGFAGAAPTAAAAAQLQAFSVAVEVVGCLSVAVGVGLTVVLRRRTGADLLTQSSAFSGARSAGPRPDHQADSPEAVDQTAPEELKSSRSVDVPDPEEAG